MAQEHEQIDYSLTSVDYWSYSPAMLRPPLKKIAKNMIESSLSSPLFQSLT